MQLESLFSKKDTMRGFQLENELICLSPQDFDRIQDFLTKLKSLRLQLNQCGIQKNGTQLILYILAKLGHDYSIFVSSRFENGLIDQCSNTTLTIPSLDDLAKSLSCEQAKLVKMGSFKSLTSKKLIASPGTTNQKDSSGK